MDHTGSLIQRLHCEVPNIIALGLWNCPRLCWHCRSSTAFGILSISAVEQELRLVTGAVASFHFSANLQLAKSVFFVSFFSVRGSANSLFVYFHNSTYGVGIIWTHVHWHMNSTWSLRFASTVHWQVTVFRVHLYFSWCFNLIRLCLMCEDWR